jgi:hypothetical protein
LSLPYVANRPCNLPSPISRVESDEVQTRSPS